MKLLVGLGNPGSKYARHRHNVGYMAADEIAGAYNFGLWRRRFQGEAAEGQVDGVKCLLLKPTTFMNDSGRSVGEAARFYKIPNDDIIVFYDELDLKPGKIRVKTGGGAAGHNGIKSVAAHLGTDFTRVRIGIGHPGGKELVYNYVLHDFAAADRDWLDPLLDAVAKTAPFLVAGDQAKFMNEVALLLRPAAAPGTASQASEQPEANAPPAPPGGHVGHEKGKKEGPFAARLRQWLLTREN